MSSTFHFLRANASLALAALALAGCAATASSTLLSLPSTTTDMPVRVISASTPVLAVGRIEVPEYLVSRRVRYKVDSSTVGEWPETYWADRIEVSISREFNAALQRRMTDWRVCEANCTTQSPAVSLQVTVVQLDYVRSEKRLFGRIKLTLEDTGPTHQVLRGEERQYVIEATGDIAQAQAQAVSDLLRHAADDAALLIATAAPKAQSRF